MVKKTESECSYSSTYQKGLFCRFKVANIVNYLGFQPGLRTSIIFESVPVLKLFNILLFFPLNLVLIPILKIYSIAVPIILVLVSDYVLAQKRQKRIIRQFQFLSIPMGAKITNRLAVNNNR